MDVARFGAEIAMSSTKALAEAKRAAVVNGVKSHSVVYARTRRPATSPQRSYAGRPRRAAVRDAIAASIATLPDQLLRSLTWDQGGELARHAQLRIDTGLAIYFCDPHSPGNAAPTRTPTVCRASTSPTAPTSVGITPADLAAVAEASTADANPRLQDPGEA